MKEKIEKNDALFHIFKRNHLVEEHRTFYSQLSFVLLGTLNVYGHPETSLLKLVRDVKLQHTYICGPTLLMTSVTEHLVALGVPAENIHTESFDLVY